MSYAHAITLAHCTRIREPNFLKPRGGSYHLILEHSVQITSRQHKSSIYPRCKVTVPWGARALQNSTSDPRDKALKSSGGRISDFSKTMVPNGPSSLRCACAVQKRAPTFASPERIIRGQMRFHGRPLWEQFSGFTLTQSALSNPLPRAWAKIT